MKAEFVERLKGLQEVVKQYQEVDGEQLVYSREALAKLTRLIVATTQLAADLKDLTDGEVSE
jgi:hypothetical protein